MYIYLNNPNLSASMASAEPLQSSNSGSERPLQLGQLLSATVESVRQNGLVQLQIAGNSLQAQSTVTPGIGQRLQLQVIGLGPPIALKVLTADQTIAASMQKGIRQALPQQNSMTPLLANLHELTKPQNTVSLPRLPPNIMDAVARLQQQLPSLPDVSTGKGLEQAIKQSGLLLESQIAADLTQSKSPALKTDIKTELLRLWTALQAHSQTNKAQTAAPAIPAAKTTPSPTTTNPVTQKNPNPTQQATATTKSKPIGTDDPNKSTHKPADKFTLPPLKGSVPTQQTASPASLVATTNLNTAIDDLFEQVVASLARLQLHQIASMPTDLQPNVSWLFELPIKYPGGTDIVHMHLEQGSDTEDEDGQHIWRVKLAFDLNHLGPLHVDLRLRGNELAANVYTEQVRTKQLVEQSIEDLVTDLNEEGVTLKKFICQLGSPPEHYQKPPDNLVDTKA